MSKKDIYFIYDGECPLCNSTAHAFRIKKDYASLNLINARELSNDPILTEINRRNLDLDEGMVIYAENEFYHGKEALKFMAKYGESTNAFTAVCKSLFWSDLTASITYPWMRGARNWFLKRNNTDRIDNLKLKDEPIFKSVFVECWNKLPSVFKKHYGNRPYTNDVTVVEGTLNVMCKPPLLWLAPIMKVMGQIPARNQNDVHTVVEFKSDRNSKSFHLNRVFYFKNKSPYSFQSRMIQIKGNQVIEIMRFRLGWKMIYEWDGEKIILRHNGYALNLFGHFIPVPLTLFMGKGYAEETAIDDNTFDMMTNITHPLWGKVYEYKGRFEIN